MKFDVVLVPFPFDDLSGQNVRPAACLTDHVTSHKHVVLAFITSVLPARLEPSDLLLTPATPGFAQPGLRVPSVLRLHRLITVAAGVIHRQLGVLPPNIQAQIAPRLRSLLVL